MEMKVYQVILEAKMTMIINAENSDIAKDNAVGAVTDMFPEAWGIKVENIKEVRK
jgi:hypothetical protein